MLKVLSTELFQRISELLIDASHEYGGVTGRIGDAGSALDAGLIHLIARPQTIFAGTSEIQRNILAKAIIAA
jgi:alkylation response protein AidB-like acyl-CoA dehydrogenase